ncbi:MAG: LemA family protein [Candidatus Hinthialibacter antarcticus]|nr:LemA family protein [Candidatus Hinthialibacter antarcticus]
MEIIIGLGVLLFFGLIWLAVMYNNLVRANNHVSESWSDIDTELKRRYNLVPNLVETVKGYAAHEKDLFERVIQARNQALANQGAPAEQAVDENALAGQLNRLLMLVENYPDLKANQNFLALQQELTNTEDRIQRARRFYNGNVRDLNNLVEVFPSNIIAGMSNFTKRDYFEIEEPAERQAVNVEM